MLRSTIDDLPPPPPGRIGWPWTEECPQFPGVRPDGTPWPRITIVTPSFNQGQFIEETIRSILLQGYPNLEYLIMDGGSTDDSVEIISKYAPWLAHWESVKDRGQAHAINKGLERATGDWFQFINSDDVLEPNTLKNVGLASVTADAIAGGVQDFGDSNSTIRRNRRINAPVLLRSVGLSNASDFHQPGIFLRRDRLTEIGGFDEGYRYTFDFKTIALYLDRYPDVHYAKHIFIRFRIHPRSKSGGEGRGFGEEFTRARRDLLATGLSRNAARACRSYLDQLEWPGAASLIAREAENKLVFVVRMLDAIAERPETRLNRFSLGMFKRRLATKGR